MADPDGLAFTCRLSKDDAEIADRLQEFCRLDSRADTVRFALREAARSRNLLVEGLPGARGAGLPAMRGGIR